MPQNSKNALLKVTIGRGRSLFWGSKNSWWDPLKSMFYIYWCNKNKIVMILLKAQIAIDLKSRGAIFTDFQTFTLLKMYACTMVNVSRFLDHYMSINADN